MVCMEKQSVQVGSSRANCSFQKETGIDPFSGFGLLRDVVVNLEPREPNAQPTTETQVIRWICGPGGSPK